VAPTPTATPKITPIPMEIAKEAFTDTVAQGGDASVSVRTEASAKCVIEVLYDSGPSQASGLDPKTASAAGKAIWSWRVGGNTKTGVYPVTVICTLDGRGHARARAHRHPLTLAQPATAEPPRG
jgi:hypothetical protein